MIRLDRGSTREEIMAGASLPARSEIPLEQQWDGASIFADDEAWSDAFVRAGSMIEELNEFETTLGRGPSRLADWLTALEAAWQSVEMIYLYAGLFHNADVSDQEAAAKEGRARGLFSRFAAAVAFAEPELLAIDGDTLRSWMAQEPRLAHYGHYFDQLERQRAHIRSAEVEEVLGQLSDPFSAASATHGILADADLEFAPARDTKGDEYQVAQGTIDALLAVGDRELRRSAWRSYADAHLSMRNAMANCLATCVKQHVLTARVRRYESCLEAALAGDNIPTAVFHSFISAFERNLPTWHRYWKLRRQALNLEQLGVWDIKAPLTSNPPEVSYDQAVDWICAGMAPLGEAYVDALRRGATEQRWVDARPNQGKRAGAFSTGVKGAHPFVLMSYTDDVFSLSTLAHELGHSMHSLITWQTQPMIYSEYSIFAAEVASNFNQALVRRYLLEHQTERSFRIALLEEALNNFHRYFFIMPTLARFELEIHQREERGEGLTADRMITLMRDLFAEGYGDEVTGDDERVGVTWAQFPTHLYANFYVYQYGTGISAAHALADQVTAGEPGAVERYLDFLRAGGSKDPIVALREAGVDLEEPEPVDRAFSALAAMIDELEALLLG